MSKKIEYEVTSSGWCTTECPSLEISGRRVGSISCKLCEFNLGSGDNNKNKYVICGFIEKELDIE